MRRGPEHSPEPAAGRRHARWLAAVVVLGAACDFGAAWASDHSLAPERQREILRDALNAFDQAVAAAREDATKAAELYRRAAAGFETLRDAGLNNAALAYNLGNTYYRLGDLGRAVVHYRRGLRLAPRDARLLANREYARSRVEPQIQPTGERRLLHDLLFWQHYTSLNERFWLALLLSATGWLALILRLRWPATPVLVTGIICIALGLANAGLVAWQWHDEARYPSAVVVDGPHVLHLGRGEAYEPALKEPLGPGVELRIISARGDWVEVRLPNDQTGWLPAHAVLRM